MDNTSHINPPIKILANDESWGPDPSAFWNQLVAKCEKERSPNAVSATALEELASKFTSARLQQGDWTKQAVILPNETDLWIIGDLHGDLIALRALTKFASYSSAKDYRQAAICFLGDFFDDGPFGHTVLYEALTHVLSSNPSGFFVTGNHDLALSWSEAESRFNADVAPHDFADWLNNLPTDCHWRKFVRAAIVFFSNAPRALLLDDGTLIAHGGCVHSDRLEALRGHEGSSHRDVMEDLVWLRAHDTAKRKVPNRTARGCQFGVADLAAGVAGSAAVCISAAGAGVATGGVAVASAEAGAAVASVGAGAAVGTEAVTSAGAWACGVAEASAGAGVGAAGC